MKKSLIFLVLSPLLALLLVGILSIYLIFYWRTPAPDKIFQIKPGEGFASINYRLKEEGLINSSKVFYRYVKWKDRLTHFKTGKFHIPAASTMVNVFTILTQGKEIGTSILIPEGKNFYEIGKILQDYKITSYQDFISWAQNPQLLQELDIPFHSVEGYLYPDTYQFTPGMSAEQVIKLMVQQFKNKWPEVDISKSSLTPQEIIILASMVEKETGARSERTIIAGVFHNRLKKKMRLQSDPTTIYGIYEKFHGNLKRKDLMAKNPYNTYQITGLPIGPICNPGIDAIKAVVGPAQHNYLYFVSRNDGTHKFSANYKDHVLGVNEYQRNAANREGKSWRNLQQETTGGSGGEIINAK